MRVLIVQEDRDLARLWASHLQRSGANVAHAVTQDEATATLRDMPIDIVILSLTLRDGSALAIADYAGYRRPAARIIPVTSASFFSDGSVFNLMPNACTSVEAGTAPEDLTAIVTHYGTAP